MAEGDWPDIEKGLRAYLRADPDVTALVNSRVFFGVPRKDPIFPLITVSRIGGGEDRSEADVDVAVYSVSCWGNSSKQEALDVANAVRKALRKIRGRTALAPGVIAFGATVDTVLWRPDPADDRPRYIVTGQVTAIAA
jgi:hypothetical protein